MRGVSSALVVYFVILFYHNNSNATDFTVIVPSSNTFVEITGMKIKSCHVFQSNKVNYLFGSRTSNGLNGFYCDHFYRLGSKGVRWGVTGGKKTLHRNQETSNSLGAREGTGCLVVTVHKRYRSDFDTEPVTACTSIHFWFVQVVGVSFT